MKKYAFANVKIPLEVLSNGNFELLKEHIQVEFTECKELPPKQELNMDFSSILNDLFKQEKINMKIEKQEEREIKIKEFIENDIENEGEQEEQSQTSDNEEEEEEQTLKKQEEQEELFVLESEIKNNKYKKKNNSFKNRKNSHNYTNKLYVNN
jgi:hypothetical protein